AARPIVVYGATGTAGRLIVRVLLARGHRVTLSGRDPARLAGLAGELARTGHGSGAVDVRPAAIHDRARLAAAMDGAGLVVACAGPFARVGEPVARTAVASGLRYLDIATEQRFLRALYEGCDAAARRAGLTVLGGMGAQVALGDFAAHAAAAALPRAELGASPAHAVTEPVDEVAVIYGLRGLRPSAGMRQALASSMTGVGYAWVRDRWDEVAAMAEYRSARIPAAALERTSLEPHPAGGRAPDADGSGGGDDGDGGDDGSAGAEWLGELRTAVSFPSGEVITVPRHVRAERVQTYVAVAAGDPLGPWLRRLLPTVGSALSWLLRSPLAAQARSLLDIGPAAPSPDERAGCRFAVVAEARRGQDRARVMVSGGDVHATTATIVAWAAERLLTVEALPTGVLAPSEVFAADRLLAELAAAGHVTVWRE
ncbi:MAG: saccharopine dehydrogenase NADP-binding domain-containing protein, partial [Myxococcota bacterium]